MRIAFSLIILLLLICSSALAQQDATRMFKKYTTKDGLLSNGIYSLHRSKNGMWWIGTGSGLQRFDGYTFESWNELRDTTETPSIAAQNVYEDNHGNVWLLTLSENYVLPAGSRILEKVRTKPTLEIPYPDNMPLPALEDEQRLWCYQHNTGFYGFNKTTLEVDTLVPISFKPEIQNSLSSLPAVSNFENKFAWASLDFEDSSYVVRFAPGKPLFTKSFSSTQYGHVKGIIPVNNEEILFIGTHYTALCHYQDLENPIKVLSKENIPGNFIRGLPHERLKVYNTGSILFPGEKGIYEYIPAQRTLSLYSASAHPEINLSRQLMFTLKEDEWGNLWIGRDGSDGLLVYYPGKLNFQFLKAPQEYFNLVYSVAVTADGSVYAANFQKGLNAFDNNGVWRKHIPLPDNENGLSPSIRTMAIFNSNQLILKSLHGKLLLLNTRTHALTDLSSIIPAQAAAYQNIFDANLYRIKDNEAQYTHGPYVLNVTAHNGNYEIHAIDSLPQQNITALAYSHEGTRIVGTTSGIYVKDSNWRVLKGTETFTVKHIAIDSEGSIWASGPRGMCVVKRDGKTLIYNEANGLLNEFIYGVLFDNNGNTWYSSNRGIGCIHKNGTISFFTEADGLQGDEFDTQSFWKSADGKLYFGGINGITAFYPDDVLQKVNPGRVMLSAIRVNEDVYPLTGRVEDVTAMNLLHDQNALTFHFTLNNFSDPEYNVYQVKLDGFDQQWLNLKNSHSMRYLLPPGDYTLHLKGSSDGSNWSEEVIIPITIHAAWWQTNLFKATAGILTILLAVSGFAYYNRIKTAELKKQMQFEQEVQKERERISRDLHDHIGAYSTALIANAETLEQTLHDPKSLTTLSYLKENSRHILTTLRETIWLLNSSNLTITGFYEGFISFCTNILRNHEGIEIEFKDQIVKNPSLPPATAIHLLRILQEVIQNITKHAYATKITCVINSEEQIAISITDNGKGFNSQENKSGNGLRNMKQRAEEINFQLDITSTTKGTKVTLTGSV